MELLVPILVLAALLGLIPAVIAEQKGHNFIAWWLFGAALFIVALPTAILLKPGETSLIAEGGQRKCPFCAELVRREAVVCRFCSQDLPAEEVQSYPAATAGFGSTTGLVSFGDRQRMVRRLQSRLQAGHLTAEQFSREMAELPEVGDPVPIRNIGEESPLHPSR